MGDHEMLLRLQAGEAIDRAEFIDHYDPLTKLIVESGGLFQFAKNMRDGEIEVPKLSATPRPMTIARDDALKTTFFEHILTDYPHTVMH